MVWGSEARRPLRQRPVVQPARGRSPSPSGRLAEPALKPRRAPSWEARSLLGRGQQPFSVKGRIINILSLRAMCSLCPVTYSSLFEFFKITLKIFKIVLVSHTKLR